MPWGRHLGGGTLPGPAGGGYPARGVPCRGGTLPGPAGGGGTQLGQQKEYSLHGGRYASCIHAGGLSCVINYKGVSLASILFTDHVHRHSTREVMFSLVYVCSQGEGGGGALPIQVLSRSSLEGGVCPI